MILLKLTSRGASFKNRRALLWPRNLLWKYADFSAGCNVNNERGNISLGAFSYCVVVQ